MIYPTKHLVEILTGVRCHGHLGTIRAPREGGHSTANYRFWPRLETIRAARVNAMASAPGSERFV